LNVLLSGRGHQLRQCVERCKGQRFLFVHADCRVPQNFLTKADSCLDTPGVVAGAFQFQLDVLKDGNM